VPTGFGTGACSIDRAVRQRHDAHVKKKERHLNVIVERDADGFFVATVAELQAFLKIRIS
jgi:hypothetical protein